jgi:hypothetical protein
MARDRDGIGAGIERLGPIVGNAFELRCQAPVAHDRPHRERRSRSIEEQRAGRRIEGCDIVEQFERRAQARGDRKAIARQADCGAEQSGPGQATVPFVGKGGERQVAGHPTLSPPGTAAL